jgi:hypothetical protein
MHYDDMVIEAANATLERTPEKQRIGRFTVRVLGSPAGEMRPEEAVPISYDDKQLQLALQQLEGRTLDRAALIAFGRTLALLLLPPPQDGAPTGVRELLAASLAQIGPAGCACACACRRCWPRCRGSMSTSSGPPAATAWMASWHSTHASRSSGMRRWPRQTRCRSPAGR